MQLSQYLDLFVSEAQDHLQEMNRCLLALEEAPDDLGYLESFFRSAHTLKGMSAALGHTEMAGLAHDMEDLLDILRHRQRRLSADLADLLFRGLDALSGQLQQIAAGKKAADAAPLRELFQAALAGPTDEPAAAAAPPPAAGWEVRVEIAPDCLLRGPRAVAVLLKCRAVAPPSGSDPPEADLRAGRYERVFRLFFPATADPDALQQAAASTAEVVAAEVRSLAPPDAAEEGRPAPDAAALHLPETPLSEEGAAAAPVVRIKVSLLDQLLEAVADMVINRSHLLQVARRHALPDLEEVIESHTAVLDRLQEAVLAMRMTPVAQVMNRFPRMVRDLAHAQGKQVRLEVQGTEIELDRTILEKVTDPLVHLLRNAVDHGVETPEERQSRGKPLPAHIVLRTRRTQDRVVIEVLDDGPGMDRHKIAALAVERGIITAQESAEMDEATVLELVCRPGFSTRSAVTDVSGRGVGMEVVKKVMDEIGGTLEIESQPGRGSRFRLLMPATLAIIPALLVREDGETYALPLTHVVRTVEVLPREIRRLHDQPVIDWEGRLLPLARLGEVLAAAACPEKPRQLPPGAAGLTVVVVERGRQRYGLVVDEILGREEIVLKPLGQALQRIEGLAGATIRGAGEVVMVLDVPGLVRSLAREEGGRAP